MVRAPVPAARVIPLFMVPPVVVHKSTASFPLLPRVIAPVPSGLVEELTEFARVPERIWIVPFQVDWFAVKASIEVVLFWMMLVTLAPMVPLIVVVPDPEPELVIVPPLFAPPASVMPPVLVASMVKFCEPVTWPLAIGTALVIAGIAIVILDRNN